MAINLSPKYGINPTVPICFWCNKEKNEIAVLGKLPNDTKAPDSCLLDYWPCDQCETIMHRGIVLIGTTAQPFADGRPPICDNVYPTGNWIVVKPDAIYRIFDPHTATDIINKGWSIIEDDLLAKIIPDE